MIVIIIIVIWLMMHDESFTEWRIASTGWYDSTFLLADIKGDLLRTIPTLLNSGNNKSNVTDAIISSSCSTYPSEIGWHG